MRIAGKSLFPREHGAWGQLIFPVVGALSLAVPTLPAVLFAGAGVCLFFAHEPFLVWLGQRGKRQKDGDEARVRRWLMGWTGLGLALGFAGWLASPWSARWGRGIPVVLGIQVLQLVLRKKEKTLLRPAMAAGDSHVACERGNGTTDGRRVAWVDTRFRRRDIVRAIGH
jgi:hypothetical protein